VLSMFFVPGDLGLLPWY